MFWQKTRVVLLSGLLVLTWVLASQANSISFTSSTYTASASAYDLGGEMDVPNDVTHTSPPSPIFTTIDHSASVGPESAPTASAAAGASGATQLTQLYANASVSAPGAQAYSSMVAEFQFTATFPQIKIKYDYDVLLTGTGSETTTYGGILVYLEDRSAGGMTTVHDLVENKSGTLNELIALASGHDYLLRIGTYLLGAEINEGSLASASVSLSNIDIQAVPLPPSLLLLGAGLLRLWGWRRRQGH